MNQSHVNVAQHATGILTVITGTLTVLGVINPVLAVIPPPWGTVAVTVTGILSYALKALKPLFPTGPATPNVTTAVKVLLPFLAILPLINGCAALTTSAGQTVELAAVDSAIAIAEQKGVSASTINALAKLALTGDTVASGIIAGLMTKANPQLTEAQAQLSAALQEAITKTGG